MDGKCSQYVIISIDIINHMMILYQARATKDASVDRQGHTNTALNPDSVDTAGSRNVTRSSGAKKR